ncbi:MAG: transposase [bacterium]|nr:transposase [bacterium]
MSVPIICLDARLRQFCERFRGCFSKPQYKYLVTVLLALMLCHEPRTLSGLLRQVAEGQSLSGLSRFMSEAPWSAAEVAGAWIEGFHEQMAAAVEAEHARQRRKRPKRAGRPRATVVTGYLIGDDSTQHKPKGKQMGGLGRHHSTTERGRVPGHSLVAGLYLLLGRRCPLVPQMYSQKTVCEREGVPFRSKVDIMETIILTFEPVAGTLTHVLLDTWYTSKRIWRAARNRGFLITSGLKCNRSLRIEDPQAERGWRWQRVDEYATELTAEQYQKVTWPSQSEQREVYVHVVRTRVRKLYTCQVVIGRSTLDCPPDEVRYWASSDPEADLLTLVKHIATRWTIEVLFSDAKDLLGLDQYQLMDATAVVRFWTLAMAAYFFLDQERARLREERQTHVTIGDARREVQRLHWRHLLDWLHEQFSLGVTPAELHQLLAA